MDLALNNLQRLICHKTQPTNNYLLRIVTISYLKPYSCVQIVHIRLEYLRDKIKSNSKI